MSCYCSAQHRFTAAELVRVLHCNVLSRRRLRHRLYSPKGSASVALPLLLTFLADFDTYGDQCTAAYIPFVLHNE